MRLYCHTCGKVTPFNSLSSTAISCEKCNHQQSINSMAQRKTGSVTGANLDRKTGKGSLTGSKRFDAPDPLADSDTLPSTPTTTTRTPSTTSRPSNSGSGDHGGGGGLTTGNTAFSYQKAVELASKYGGFQPSDIASMLGSNPYAPDGDIPEMGAKEANTAKLKIQRQRNAISVRHEKTKLGRDIVKSAIEEVGLVGDLVDYATAQINTATKVIKNEIALTQYDIENSRLTQTQELFTQQEIATLGTIALTQGIKEEWDLKLAKQGTRNDGIRIEIEGGLMENDRKREELEARLIAG